MTLPNFLILGAHRAGTTALYAYLAEHPDVYMSVVKEPAYFSNADQRDDGEDGADDVAHAQRIHTLEAYRALFAGAAAPAVGEASTSYLYSRAAAEGIRRHIPDAKLIALLRNPIERAYSNYLMDARLGVATAPDFFSAVCEEHDLLWAARPSKHGYLERGFYYESLEHYRALFPGDCIRLYLYDDWLADPYNLVCDVFRFLEVDDTFVPDMTAKHNVSSFAVGAPRPSFTSEARQRLAEIYRDEIRNLESFLNRDLSIWLDARPASITVVPSSIRMVPARLVAFYLPQYHPTAENDAWWGTGFTDWNNVAKAAPLFSGHYQPHVAGELGAYDLRDPAVRQAQAELAREHGIDAFCYYHYWFNGRRLLDRPFREVLVSGKPGFPFCLCWANENWTRNWDGRRDDILVQQHYDAGDDVRHIRWLIHAFRDERYLRVDGKALLLVYRASLLARPLEMTSIWRDEAASEGVELYLAAVESLAADRADPKAMGFDAAVDFQPDWTALGSPSRRVGKENVVYDYAEVVANMLRRPAPGYLRFPCVTPGWDNSPRRQQEATILDGSRPDVYQRWLEEVIRRQATPFGRRRNPDENLVFINAWNEWAEGAHLEPDRKSGRAYLEATRNAVQTARAQEQLLVAPHTGGVTAPDEAMREIMSLYLPPARA